MVWNADYAEGYDFLYYLYSSQSIARGNYTGYRIPQADSLLKAAAAEVNSKAEREDFIRKASRMITDDAPMLWLYQPKTFKLLGKNVQDFEVNGMNQIDWLRLGLKSEAAVVEGSQT
jgi:ABC-type transport system substrate-binding protein